MLFLTGGSFRPGGAAVDSADSGCCVGSGVSPSLGGIAWHMRYEACKEMLGLRVIFALMMILHVLFCSKPLQMLQIYVGSKECRGMCCPLQTDARFHFAPDIIDNFY